MSSSKAMLDELRMQHPDKCHDYYTTYDRCDQLGAVTRLAARPAGQWRGNMVFIGQVAEHPTQHGKFVSVLAPKFAVRETSGQRIQQSIDVAHDTVQDAIDFLKLEHMTYLC